MGVLTAIGLVAGIPLDALLWIAAGLCAAPPLLAELEGVDERRRPDPPARVRSRPAALNRQRYGRSAHVGRTASCRWRQPAHTLAARPPRAGTS